MTSSIEGSEIGSQSIGSDENMRDIANMLADEGEIYFSDDNPDLPTNRDEPVEKASGFLAAFPNIAPAACDLEGCRDSVSDEDSIWLDKIPENYRRHWERVPDILKTIPVVMKGFSSVRMTPKPEHEGRMFGESKCFSMINRSSLEHLAGPQSGMTYCFVSECLSEIPSASLKALFFFDNCRRYLQTQDRSPYVFPSDKIGLMICRKNKKSVTGLYAKGERGMDDQASVASSSQEHGYISTKKILEARAYEQPEETKSPINEIKISLGFTGAEYIDKDGKKKHKTFSVVMVTPAANFSMWSYIYEVLLCPPKMGSMQFTPLMEFYSSMKDALEEILNNEMVVNLGVLQQDFGVSSDYRFNSGGALGVLTILSPFAIPTKIAHVILSKNPEASAIKILGMPDISFKADNLNTTDWITAMHRSITANQRIEERDSEILQKYNGLKDKSMFEDAKQDSVGGWPLVVDSNGTVLVFGLPPLPIKLTFNTQGSGSRNYDSWFSKIGGAEALPVLVRALLRSYLVDTSDQDVFPEISHFLNDTRKADPVLLFNTYFSASVDPFKSLMIVNSQKVWWEAFLKDTKKRREDGMSVEDAVKNLENYTRGVIFNMDGMVSGGAFRSKTISQMKFIVDTLDFGEVCMLSESSIAKQMHHLCQKISPSRKYDRMYRAWHAFSETFSTMNRSFYLNPANLVCAIEIMVSQVLHKFGGTNETWTYFFTTLMIMPGNGHFKMMGEGGIVPDRRKPNGTGADAVVNRVGDIINTLYEILGTPDKERYLHMLYCTRFTDTVWEQQSTATAAGGELVTQPSPELNDRPMAMTEMRKVSIESLILNVFPRNDTVSQSVALNSCDPQKTGVRQLAEKTKVAQPAVIITCTNTADTVVTAEHTRTAMVVSPVLPPGSGLPCNKRTRQQFQDIARDVNTGRHRELDSKQSVAFFLTYTQVFTQLYGGLVNRVRAIPYEINQTTAALIEWASFFLQEYGIMESTVRANYSRMVQGYTTRAIAWFAWLKTIDHLSTAKDLENKEETIKSLLLDLHADALPIIAVPQLLMNMMSRSVNMSSLLMIMAVAENMGVPVVSWKGLNRFFDDDEPPVEEGVYMDEYVMIRSFFVECIENHRFCPGEDGSWDSQNNISCYVTGEGRESLLPLHENSGFLRFLYNKNKPGDEHSMFSLMAHRFQKEKGKDMLKTCHMGDKIAYKIAFEELLKYTPDFRGLASHRTYFSRKHFSKMGLLGYLPGLTDHLDYDAPPFARHVLFKEGDQIKSEGFGVNPWSMLSIVALAGQILVHPCISDSFASGLVKEVLAKSPPGATPGDIAASRFFDSNSKPVRIFLPSSGRPQHFLRPEDDTFPSTGILPLARGLAQWLPEDMLHCPMLYPLANTLKCSLMEVPASAVKSQYNLQPDKAYPFHIPGDEHVFGSVIVSTGSSKVFFTEGDQRLDPENRAESVHVCDFFNWDSYILEKGYVLTPLVERGGACILVDIGGKGDQPKDEVVGCLIKYPDTGSQYNAETGDYQALVREDNSIMQVFFKDVMRSLIPVGRVMYLRMEVIQDAKTGHPSRTGKFLFTRLNVPNVSEPVQGKIYVTGIYKTKRTRSQAASESCITFAVNPWDLILDELFKGEQNRIVQHLE